MPVVRHRCHVLSVRSTEGACLLFCSRHFNVQRLNVIKPVKKAPSMWLDRPNAIGSWKRNNISVASKPEETPTDSRMARTKDVDIERYMHTKAANNGTERPFQDWLVIFLPPTVTGTSEWSGVDFWGSSLGRDEADVAPTVTSSRPYWPHHERGIV